MLKNILVYKRNSEISRLAKIYPFSKITNSKIGEYSYMNLFANINNTTIGKFCSISMNFKTGLGMHPTNFISTSPLFYSKKNALKLTISKVNCFNEYMPITIGNDVWIGADVVILDGVKIGDGAIIAAKSVVTKDVPDYAIVGGVPAKFIRYRFSEEIRNALIESKWWDADVEYLKEHIELFNMEPDLNSIGHLLRSLNREM